MKTRRTYELIYAGTIFYLVAVPGSAFVSIKVLLMVLLSGATLIRLATFSIPRTYWIHAAFWLSYIMIWTVIGLINNDTTDALREAVAYFAFFIFVYCFIVGLRWVNGTFITKTLMVAVITYSILKFGILMGIFLGAFDPESVYWMAKEIAPGVVVSGFSGGAVPRITLANDYVLPMVLLLALVSYMKRMISKKIFGFFFVVVIIMIAGTLSRYLYLLSGIILMGYFSFYINKKRVFSFGVFALLLGLITVTIVFFQLGYNEKLYSRFWGHGAASSDAAKQSQIEPLISMIDSSKLIGSGFGLSMRNTGRGNKSSFQAEVQWLALTAKVGLIGIFTLLGVLVVYSKHLLLSVRTKSKVTVLLSAAWILWLLSGFFNPVMLLTTTSVNYVIFDMLSKLDSPLYADTQ